MTFLFITIIYLDFAADGLEAKICRRVNHLLIKLYVALNNAFRRGFRETV
jgi:hypothetical protein